ncbi:MAG: tetratricopeptide repeat protein [Phenylobacterium sp.]|uniref:tetratricopeptide repeat protein n=1 Tax=Phenylobacterium sp. TaxID=1871053 RepID=UPI002735B816|nr:tetratricopeptide repeat protein [Phenylobacterium sp.]MDP3173260.1 tetratricopeptide repeat protein [Phenylobacterium sp.]
MAGRGLRSEHVLAEAVNHHRAGRVDEARRLYAAVLKLAPKHPDANHNLGALLLQGGSPQAALPHFRAALKANPAIPQFWLSYIQALSDAGQIDEARETLAKRRTLGLRGPAVEALEARLAQALPPAEVEAVIAALRESRPGEAVALAQDLTYRFPQNSFGWKAYGAALTTLGRAAEAVPALEKALTLAPAESDAHHNLGLAMSALGRLVDGEASFRQAVALNPQWADPQLELGVLLFRQDRLPEAEATFRELLQTHPDHARAHGNLGAALKGLGRAAEAEASIRRALELQPESADALCNLGVLLKDVGRLAEAEACYRHALEIDPQLIEARSNLLLVRNYMPRETPQALREEAERFGRIVAGRATPFSTWTVDPNPQRLRVGLVSGDLRDHAVGFFLESVLHHIDPARVELVAYPTRPGKTDLTHRIRPRFAAWTPIHGLDDAAAASRIRDDGVHLLIDLAGHTGHNRLPLFAWKAAPVQATWLGYFATTGIKEIDYVIGDPWVLPVGEADHFVERPWRLPDSYLCLTPPVAAPDVAPLPALKGEGVTFGSFNNLTKLNDPVVALWASILKAVDGSRLFLKTVQFGSRKTTDETLDRFAVHGVPADRLILEGPSSRADLLAAYGRVDIALDPFPYPGGTTSAEAAWMGVPVITLRGDRFLSHVGESVARNAGLADWIAQDQAEYVAMAFRRAADLPALATVRAGLRERLGDQPLFDAARFAGDLQDALWGMWDVRRQAG